jgi:signal transduction histidine kinase
VAKQERQRISRDLHDSTVQPYIGLKLGLEALRRRVSADSPEAAEIDELSEMAKNGIAELRRYVADLRSSPESALGEESEESLAFEIRRQAEKLREFCGVDINVTAEDDMPVKRHVFNEVMHIVRESLSNIRRHTPARQATIALHNLESCLIVEFLNDGATSGQGAAGFFPRSIAERARDLGGRVNVEQSKTGHTTVAVEIPL